MKNTSRRSFIKATGISTAGLLLTPSHSFAACTTYPRIEKIPQGAWAVMMTPFDRDLKIDYSALGAMVRWYEDAGVSGLFTNCLSSEMYNLTAEERIQMTGFVVEKSRIPVVSTGTFYPSVEENVDFIKQIHRTGVNGVVLITSILVGQEADEKELLKTIHAIVEKTEGIPLGLYECPSPYKRLVSPEALREIVATDRFVYLKDTSCDAEIVNKKISVAKDSLLGIYNAHTPDALYTIRNGGAGVSPIAGNFYPELFSYLCKYGNDESKKEEVSLINDFLLKNEALIGKKYSLAAKYFMQIRGLPLLVNSRKTDAELDDADKEKLNLLLQDLKNLMDDVKINRA